MINHVALYIIAASCLWAGLSKSYKTDPIDSFLLCVIALTASLTDTVKLCTPFLVAVSCYCAKQMLEHLWAMHRVRRGHERRKVRT